MYIELTVFELKEIQHLLKEIEWEVSFCINTMNKYVDNGDYLAGQYSEEISNGIEEMSAELQEAMEFIQDFDKRLTEIIQLVEDKAKVMNEDVTFIYDSSKLEKNLKHIKELLDFTGLEYKKVVKLSSTYEEWERSISSKLDNTAWEVMGNPIEEAKQKDDELVFRHNKKIMQGIEEKVRNISFLDSIDNIEDIKKKLDSLKSLEEIKDITDILARNIKFGKVTLKPNNISISQVDELLIIQATEEFKNSLPNELIDMIEKFKSGGVLVVNGTLITDDILQKINNSGFFNIETVNGKYKFSLKYSNITEWARENSKIIENIADDAMKKGISGIYKLDESTHKWYVYDEAGNKKYITELPDGASKGVSRLNKILGPLGIALDVNTIYQGWKSGDPSEFGGAVGSVAGAWIGLTILAAIDPVPGDALVLGMIITVIAGGRGTKLGGITGEKIGEMFEDEKVYWE